MQSHLNEVWPGVLHGVHNSWEGAGLRPSKPETLAALYDDRTDLDRLIIQLLSEHGETLSDTEEFDFFYTLIQVKVTGKGRARTVRQRLKVAVKFSRHLGYSGNNQWTTSSTDLIDYMNSRANEPCGRTVLWDILRACLVIGELDEFEPKASKDPLVVACADSLTLTLSRNCAPRRQAQDYPTLLVVGWELAVWNERRDRFWRSRHSLELMADFEARDPSEAGYD
jgi:hypothetical protein